MTPSELFNWAFAIALGWGVIVFFMPIDKWLGAFFARRQTRLKNLEERVSTLEHKLKETAAQSHQAD